MITTLKDLFIEQLKDLYHAEKQLEQVLPRLSAAATSADVKNLLDKHFKETNDHVTRLEKVFELIGVKPEERKCRAMVGLISEADDVLKDCEAPEVRDAAIVSSAQRIQHYEMAGYGTARTYARTLGEDDAADVLQQTLDEEGRMDDVLTKIAKQSVNPEAIHA